MTQVAAAGAGKATGPRGTPRASGLGAAAATGQIKAAQARADLERKMVTGELQQQQQQQIQQDQMARAQQQQQARMAQAGMATQAQIQRGQMAGEAERARMQRQAQEEMRLNAIDNAAQQSLQKMAADKGVAVDDLLHTLEYSDKELELRRDAAEIEQIGFGMAMQNRQYLAEQNRIGRLRQLEDQQAWQTEMADLYSGWQVTDTLDQIGWQAAYNEKQRDFDYRLAGMNANMALQLAQAEIKAANQKAMIQAGTEAMTAGIKYGAKAGWFDEEEE
jgi:hypothetical protein